MDPGLRRDDTAFLNVSGVDTLKGAGGLELSQNLSEFRP